MKKRLKLSLIALAVGALLGGNAASADLVEINGWWGNQGTVALTFNGTNYHDGSSASFTKTLSAGAFKVYNLTADPLKEYSFQAWCSDIFRYFYFGIQTTDILTPATSIFGGAKGNDLGRLYTNQHLNIINPSSSADRVAAFQLTVWEIANEANNNTYSLATGNLTAASSSAGYATAQAWLSQLNDVPSVSLYTANIWSVQDTQPAFGYGAQDLVVFAPVPEPETYVLLLAGLGMIGFVVKRRRRHAAC